jgi:uncharacterized Zn finger protein
MPSVADLVEPPNLPQLANTGVLEAGLALAEQGSVTLVKFGPVEVHATVQDNADRHVELASTADGLSWSCDCPEGKQGEFCKHCVAAAKIAWEKSPPRRIRHD